MPGLLDRLLHGGDDDDGPRVRDVRDGDGYTLDELRDGLVRLIEPDPDPDPPPEETRGEPWGWTKPGPRPRGYRDDGRYGPEPGPDDPGPLDGAWPDDDLRRPPWR